MEGTRTGCSSTPPSPPTLKPYHPRRRATWMILCWVINKQNFSSLYKKCNTVIFIKRSCWEKIHKTAVKVRNKGSWSSSTYSIYDFLIPKTLSSDVWVGWKLEMCQLVRKERRLYCFLLCINLSIKCIVLSANMTALIRDCVEVKRGVELSHSIRNASRIRRKVENRSVFTLGYLCLPCCVRDLIIKFFIYSILTILNVSSYIYTL